MKKNLSQEEIERREGIDETIQRFSKMSLSSLKFQEESRFWDLVPRWAKMFPEKVPGMINKRNAFSKVLKDILDTAESTKKNHGEWRFPLPKGCCVKAEFFCVLRKDKGMKDAGSNDFAAEKDKSVLLDEICQPIEELKIEREDNYVTIEALEDGLYIEQRANVSLWEDIGLAEKCYVRVTRRGRKGDGDFIVESFCKYPCRSNTIWDAGLLIRN